LNTFPKATPAAWSFPLQRRVRQSAIGSYLPLVPALAFITIFKFGPLLYAFFLSGFEWKLGARVRLFVGPSNYAKLFTSPEFWNAMRNTVIYAICVAGLSILLGLVLALAVSHVVRLQAAYQAIFFLPVAATMSATAVVWKFIFDPNIGVLNALLEAVGLPGQNWLTDGRMAMVAVVIVGVWSSMGYAMVLFMAGLTAIPRQLHEVAAMDGATPFRQFRWITWPLLSPTTLFVVMIMTLRALQTFDSVKIMTDGGPLGATQILSHLLYRVGFQYFDSGYAASISVVFFVLLVTMTLVQIQAERRVHYE
jgi:multiple sugar transport system permease protein